MTSQADEVEQHIFGLENDRIQAFLDADTDTLERILSDDLTFIHTSTNMDSKQSFIERLLTGVLKYDSLTTESVQVRVYVSAAVVTGRATMQVTVGGEQHRYGYAYTGVYAKQDRGWQMVALQATRMPEG